MLKWIAQNKYKLMAFIIGLYLVVDVMQHKGQTRVIFPKSFPPYKVDTRLANTKNTLINLNKEWLKGVNTKERMNELNEATGGFECDVYFDTAKNIFEVHHDANRYTGLTLDHLLELYQQKKLKASIWLDIKNLTDANANAVLHSLILLRNKYGLQNKFLVESTRAHLLTAFSDSLFFTSYYTPMFNPYKLNNEQLKIWADSISTVINDSRINALSGYYFQYLFLHHYFPGFPILTWADKKRFSLVNWLFRQKLNADKAVFIALYP